MKARKVQNKSRIQVETYFPSYFKGLLNFPGIVFIDWEYDHFSSHNGDGKCRFMIKCPNDDVASELAKFLRTYFDATGAVT